VNALADNARTETAPLLVRARAGRPALDLGRDVHALLGLVFDATTVDAAAAHLRRCAATGQRCFLSTPNVNFAVAARADPAFRDSVLQSDFSVADGAPLVRLGRWLGLPLAERVAGSDLFERLRHEGDPTRPLKVFFFGGADGVAERAAKVIEADRGPMRCVGFLSPGFGSLEAMSSEDTLARINSAGADFVVVALGAQKGQAWIQRNRARLAAPLVSHLGAVVNFVAGQVRRAPRWVQALGLEWLWRVAEEPALWRRYAGDGLALLHWLASAVPLQWRLRRPANLPAARWTEVRADPAASRFALSGHWTGADLAPLRRAAAAALNEGRELSFELGALDDADSAVLALLALVDAWQVRPRAVDAQARLQPRLRDRVRLLGMQHLFEGA
jgi:N-acetylglucosaminyldiphosphoundecaprenol N-acetyl-beta-D-mannosaminyltransferase